MNRAEVERAFAAGTRPVDLMHIGSCRGMGMTNDESTGQIFCNGCPCCSKPTACPTCKHVFDIMREMMVAELERRRQEEADSQNSQGPSEQKRPAE